MDQLAQENFPTVGPSPLTSPLNNTEKKGRKGRERDDTQFVPPGWKLELVLRQSGKTKGIYDKYWYSPDGKKFKSKVSVLRYLEENPNLQSPLGHKPNEEDTIFFRDAGIKLGKRKHGDLISNSTLTPEFRKNKNSVNPSFMEHGAPLIKEEEWVVDDRIPENKYPAEFRENKNSAEDKYPAEFRENKNSVVPSSTDDDAPLIKEEEWVVEAILDSRFNAALGATQYCTLWVDGSITWEPAKNFVDENGSQNTLFLEFIKNCEIYENPKSKNRTQKRKNYGYYGKDIVDNYTVEDEDYDPENDKTTLTTPVDVPKKSHKRKNFKSPRKIKSEGKIRNLKKCPKKEPGIPELRNNSGSFQESFQNSFEIPVLETMSYPDDEVLSDSSSLFQIVESVDNSDTSEPRWETDDWVLPSLEHIDQIFSEDFV